MKKKILGVDFDDVLFDNNTSIAAFHNARYGTSYGKEDNTDYFFEKLWGCSTEEVWRRMEEYGETEFHHEAPIIDGAKEALENLRTAYDIVIITARAPAARGVTERWLEKNLPGFVRQIYFTDRFRLDSPGRLLKSDVCKEVGVSYFVEDAPHWAEDVARNAPGTEVFLFDSPWNRKETPPGAVRVHSWEEVARALGAS
jgi:uncharacterized protein